MFQVILSIILQMYPKLHEDYLFLSTIYIQAMEEALNLRVLSNLEIIYVYLLHTKDINLNMHQLFFQEVQPNALESDANKDPRIQLLLL